MKLLLALAALPLLAACGGGDSGATYGSAEDVARAAHCTGYQHTAGTDAMWFTSDQGSCRLDGDALTIVWFKDSASIENYRTTAEQVGGKTTLYGSNWGIECDDDSADCTTLQKTLGGDVS